MAVIEVTGRVYSSDGHKKVETGVFVMPGSDGHINTKLRHIDYAKVTTSDGTDRSGLFVINSEAGAAENEVGFGGRMVFDISTFNAADTYSYYVRGN